MRIKTSTISNALIQDNVFLMFSGTIANGKVYNTRCYYTIPSYEFGTIIKEIKRWN